MGKLYFRHGAVGSAKTLNLLAVAHNYNQQNKRIILIKPKLDIRFGEAYVRSRAGLEREADILVEPGDVLDHDQFRDIDCVLVDEAQFVSPDLIDQLRQITVQLGVPVICYGLRTDFRKQLFDGAKRLFEVADAIEEVKTTCYYCNKKAIYNLKLLDGEPTLAGPSIDLGAEEKYLPACHHCYTDKLAEAGATADPGAM